MAPRDHAVGPWEQQDGLEMVVYRILFDSGVILGPVYISVLSSRSLKLRFFLFGTSHFLSIPESKFDDWDFQIEVSAWKLLQNFIFH